MFHPGENKNCKRKLSVPPERNESHTIWVPFRYCCVGDGVLAQAGIHWPAVVCYFCKRDKRSFFTFICAIHFARRRGEKSASHRWMQRDVGMLPKFSADAFTSNMVRWMVRARAGAVVGGLLLPAGECSDWLLCRRMVGSRATNDALCLKLEEARLARQTNTDIKHSFEFGFVREERMNMWTLLISKICCIWHW